MICPSADPLEDFRRQDEEDYSEELAFPRCDACGDRITDDSYYVAVIKHKRYKLCRYCCEEIERS